MTDIKQTRRLQLTGGSTYIVSLPKDWVDDMQLKKNSNVTLMKNPNNSITLFRDELNKKQRAVAVIGKTDSKESIKRKIIAIYLSGHNTIEIHSKGMEISSANRGVIRDLVRTSLMGTEIVETSSKKIVLQVLTKLAELSFKVALKRMYMTAANMHRESIRAIKEMNDDYAEEIVKMDDEVDRFSLYMMRNLNLSLQDAQILFDSGLEKPSECLGYRTVVKCVERIADHAALIAKKIKYLSSPIDKKLLKEIEDLSEDSLEVFENSIEALSKKDYNMAEKVASKVSKVIEKEKKQMDSIKSEENASILKLILEDIRRTAEYSSDISEVVMDENVQSVIEEI